MPSKAQEKFSSPREYDCYRIEEAVCIDGKLDDPAWQFIPWSEGFIDIEGEHKPLPWYETRFKIAWNDSCLYIAANLEEEHIWATLTKRESVIYRDNDFEVFLDPDGDGLDYFELEINAFGTEWDLFLDKPYSQKGNADFSWNIEGIRTVVQHKGSINNPDDLDTAWIVEMALPWESFLEHAPGKRKPQTGDTWRVNFSRVQWETDIQEGEYIKRTDSISGTPLREHNWVWSPQGMINMHIPEKWGYLNFSGPVAKTTPEFWIWAGANRERGPEAWDSVFCLLQKAGFKAMLLGADTAVMNTVIPLADRYGIEVHAWFWTMNRGDAKPEWLSVNRLGKSLADKKAYVDYYKFMCPALPDVKEFLLDKMNVLADVDGLKGIHMDYIRYVDAILPSGLQPKYGLQQDTVFPEFDYGYHPYMTGLFESETGKDPFSIISLADRKQWLNFRMDELTKTVDTISEAIRGHGLQVSAAVFPTPEMSRQMVRQPWDEWKLDYYFPMVYHNFYEESVDWITEVVKENKAVTPTGTKIICGLYLPALKEGNDLKKAIKAALAGGADGVALFDLQALDAEMLKGVLSPEF